MNVIVALYEHRFGLDCRVFARPEQAEVWRQDIAQNWWERELPDEDMPTNPVVAANDYFALVTKESFKVRELEVES